MAHRIKLDQRGIGRGKGRGVAGKGCGVIFGLVFALAGLAFAGVLGKLFLDDLQTYFWAEVPCELGSAEIEVNPSNQDDPFKLVVDYRYEFEGSSYQSQQHHRTGFTSSSQNYTDLERERIRLRTEPALLCYVDPKNPSEAILQRGALYMGLVILFPLIFVAVGAAVIIGSIRQGKKSAAGALEQGGISERAVPKDTGNRVGIIVLGIFLLVGCGLMYPLLIMPISRAAAAKHWPEVECQIIWSRVDSHSSDDGTTYSVNIFYEYVFEGQTYRSNRYGYIGGSSSGSSKKRDIVRKYPKGSTQLCWVNPKDPLYAVLKRELGWGVLLGLIPTVFFLIGALGLMGLLRKSGAGKGVAGAKGLSGARGVKWADGPPVSEGLRPSSGSSFDRGTGGGSRELSPGGSRVVGFIVLLCVAAFWNGIVSVFLWEVIGGFRGGDPSWFLTLFLVPFVLIGLGLIIAVLYSFLGLFNPRPIITLSPGAPQLGQTFELEWKISRGASRIAKFEVLIEASESATYRRGTNTHTDTEIFYSRVIGEGVRPEEVRSGRASLALPLDLPPSLDLGSNKIEWSLIVKGDVPLWPDITDRHKIDVVALGDQSV